MKEKSIKGRLNIYEQEGGFASPGIVVNGHDLVSFIAKAARGKVGTVRRCGTVEKPSKGCWPKVRITIEILE